MKTQIRSLTVNDAEVSVEEADLGRPLLWFLRDQLGLRGAKFGCGHGACGACTVEVDGAAVPSCTLRLDAVLGCRVRTIEGLARTPAHPVLRAWIAEQVPHAATVSPRWC